MPPTRHEGAGAGSRVVERLDEIAAELESFDVPEGAREVLAQAAVLVSQIAAQLGDGTTR